MDKCYELFIQQNHYSELIKRHQFPKVFRNPIPWGLKSQTQRQKASTSPRLLLLPPPKGGQVHHCNAQFFCYIKLCSHPARQHLWESRILHFGSPFLLENTMKLLFAAENTKRHCALKSSQMFTISCMCQVTRLRMSSACVGLSHADPLRLCLFFELNSLLSRPYTRKNATLSHASF